MKQLMQLLKSKYSLLVISVLLLIPVILFIIILLINPAQKKNSNSFLTPTITQIPTTTNSTLRVLRTIPSDKQIHADYTGKIYLFFNLPVLAQDIRLSFAPEILGKFSQKSSTEVVFIPASFLKQETHYTARLSVGNKTIISPSNIKGSTYIWSFTTDTSSGEESFTPQEIQNFQNTRAVADKAYQDRKKKYPFIIYLPYTTSHFKIDITFSNTVIITTYGTTPSQTQTYQQEALSWLQSNGGDTNTLTISYKTL